MQVQCLNRASHRANLSSSSWFGRRRLRGGAGVLGMQTAFNLMQFEHGLLRSHFFFRCWHKTQASTLMVFLGCRKASDDGFVDPRRDWSIS